MSGTPTETEVQTQWRNSVSLIDAFRSATDGAAMGAGGYIDVILQSLEGEYTPSGIANALANYRARLSRLMDESTALEFLAPVLREYGGVLAADAGANGFGSNYTSLGALFSAIYEWFHANSLTVQSRNITFDTTATAGGGNVGNGAMSRLTVDHNGYDMEACHVERKIFRCRQDQNTGTLENAEIFEFSGAQRSQDALQRDSFGSGIQTTIRSHHAGSGNGGSLLTNSSFSTYDAAGSPKFSGWTEDASPGNIGQDTGNFYRSHPGAQTDASLKMDADVSAATTKISQSISAMPIARLDTNRPYFLRIMVNPTVGSASGGTVVIRMGSQSNSIAVSSLSAGWNELLITPDESCWPRVFNEDPFDIEIEWTSPTSGHILIDDVIFAPWDAIDGTYWFLRGNAATHTPWLVDDTLTFTDTGGAPATGKIQWWNFIAGLGYLPSTTGAPTFTDP